MIMSKAIGKNLSSIQKDMHAYKVSMGDRDCRTHRSKYKEPLEAKGVKKTAS